MAQRKTTHTNLADAGKLLEALQEAFRGNLRGKLCAALQKSNELAALCPCCGGGAWCVSRAAVLGVGAAAPVAKVLGDACVL